MAVQVSLDINANPAVTMNPQIHNVNQGNETIKWEQAGNTQAFTFTSLSGLSNAPFSGLNIGSTEITVSDNNPGADALYPYSIVVTATNGQQYSSIPRANARAQAVGPAIHNK